MDGDGALASTFAHGVVRSVAEWLEGGRNPGRAEKRSFPYDGPTMTGVASTSLEATSLTTALEHLANAWLSELLGASRPENDSTASFEFSLDDVRYRLDIDIHEADEPMRITQLTPIELRVEPETHNKRRLSRV